MVTLKLFILSNSLCFRDLALGDGEAPRKLLFEALDLLSRIHRKRTSSQRNQQAIEVMPKDRQVTHAGRFGEDRFIQRNIEAPHQGTLIQVFLDLQWELE